MEEPGGESSPVRNAVRGKDLSFLGLLGPDVERRETSYVVESPVTHYRASGDPLAERMIEMLLSPPTRAELIEDAENRKFSA